MAEIIYPSAKIAEVPCPLPECEVSVPIGARLILSREWSETESEETLRYSMHSVVDIDGMSLHMIEHGLDVEEAE